MKVAFAIPIRDYEVANYMKRMAFQMNQQYGVGFYGAMLPPHISLKQPFQISDLDQIDEYFEDFARSIEPFQIRLPEMSYWVSEVMGSIFLKVDETLILRQLHNRLNQELAERFANTQALFDGEDYRFHATIALGGSAPKEVYEEFYRSLPNKKVDFQFLARELVMFYYDQDDYQVGTFYTYKEVPLGRG